MDRIKPIYEAALEDYLDWYKKNEVNPPLS
jgi:hypothetical protein